jgi:hypothetical protein
MLEVAPSGRITVSQWLVHEKDKLLMSTPLDVLGRAGVIAQSAAATASHGSLTANLLAVILI